MTLLESDGVPVEENDSTAGLDYVIVHTEERYNELVQATLLSQSVSTGNY